MLAIAHRTPAAPTGIAALAAAGATVFEIDVQEIGGELVCSHFLPVSPLLPRLRRDRVRFTVRRRGPSEVALAATVAALPPEAEVLIDLKVDRGAAAHALVERLVEVGPDPARCHASTKGWETLSALAAGGYRTWRTIGDPAALRAALELDRIPDYAVTVKHGLLTAEVLAALRDRVDRVMCWTVNDVARARTLIDLGVDGITSDSLDVLRLVGTHGRHA